MKTIFRYTVFCWVIFLSNSASAWDCNQLVSSLTASFPAKIVVQRDWAGGVGQPISNWAVSSASPQQIYACTFASSGLGYDILEYGTASNVGTYSEGGVTYNIHPTNITGVGIVLRAKSQGAFDMSGYYNFPYGSWTNNVAYGENINAYMEVDARLIVTGAFSGGVLTASTVGGIRTATVKTSTYYYTIPIGYSSTVITKVACSINTPVIQVPLDDVLGSTLTSVGTTAKPKTFDLDLNCDAGARVNVKMTGTQNTDSSAAGVLQLTNAGASNVAKGVGIQILYNNAPLALNNNIVLKTSNGGQETFQFVARYYQTKNPVSTGAANATATLNLTYQ